MRRRDECTLSRFVCVCDVVCLWWRLMLKPFIGFPNPPPLYLEGQGGEFLVMQELCHLSKVRISRVVEKKKKKKENKMV